MCYIKHPPGLLFAHCISFPPWHECDFQDKEYSWGKQTLSCKNLLRSISSVTVWNASQLPFYCARCFINTSSSNGHWFPQKIYINLRLLNSMIVHKAIPFDDLELLFLGNLVHIWVNIYTCVILLDILSTLVI